MKYGAKMKYQTDKNLSLILCHHCNHLSKNDHKRCSVCDSHLHQRKELSLLKTFCFTLIAFIFFIPANLLPMMNVTTLGTVESSTIFDGIVYFFDTKSYGIALIIFVASILVPLIKLAVLTALLLIVFFKQHQFARSGIKYFRMIHFIGKWSMIDIFVVALMIVMVQFENLSNISAGAAAPAFTIVVVMTILATHSFDTRLLWDEEGKHYASASH